MDAHFPLHVYENIGRGLPVYMHKCLATPLHVVTCSRAPYTWTRNFPCMYMRTSFADFPYTCTNALLLSPHVSFPVYMEASTLPHVYKRLSHTHAKMFWRCWQADAGFSFPYTWNSRCLGMYTGISRLLLPVYMEASLLPQVYTLSSKGFENNY